MLNNNYAFKYEKPYNGPFEITGCWTNGTVTSQLGAIRLGIIYVKLNHIHMIQLLRILFLKMMY